MRHKLKSLLCATLIAGSAMGSASALEYSYQADLYDNYFYTPTSSNHALDLNNASDSGGSTVVVGSASMEKGTNQSGAAGNSPAIPVGSYIDPWGQNVDTQIETGATLNGIADKAFNSLVGDYTLPLPTLASSSSTTSCATGIPVLVTPTFVPTWTYTVTPLYVTTPIVQPASAVYSNELFTERGKVTTIDGHFGAMSIGSRKLFAYVYPGASSASMQKGAGHVDGTSVWDGNIALCGHNRGS